VTQVAILGTGRLGEALLGGLLRSGGLVPDRVRCTVRRPDRADELAARHGVRVDTDSAGAAAEADLVVLAVKPQNLGALLADLTGALRPGTVVVSFVAGVPTAVIERALGEVPVVRVMSNTPVQVDEAMSVMAAGRFASAEHLDAAEKLLRSVGRVVRLAEEHLDAVTALSGSGPAYFFLLAEAMIDAGILLGLGRDVATDLIVQTMVGSAKMLRDSGRHPVELREAVTSPGGTTIAAIRKLEEHRVRSAFIDAIEAAQLRAAELAKALD